MPHPPPPFFFSVWFSQLNLSGLVTDSDAPVPCIRPMFPLLLSPFLEYFLWSIMHALTEPWLLQSLCSLWRASHFWREHVYINDCIRYSRFTLSEIQFTSVAQSCLTLYDSMDHRMLGLPDHHQLLEFTQTHVHWVGDAIQPSYPLSSPSPPALNLSQHQGLFRRVSSLHQVAKGLEFQLQHQSFQCRTRTDLL